MTANLPVPNPVGETGNVYSTYEFILNNTIRSSNLTVTQWKEKSVSFCFDPLFKNDSSGGIQKNEKAISTIFGSNSKQNFDCTLSGSEVWLL